jgi:hypothetical protein
MNELGRKIYYLKSNGAFLCDTGEMIGLNIRETTTDEDFRTYIELKGYNPEAVGCLKLNFGDYREEFGKGLSFMVDVESSILVFDYSQVKYDIQRQIADYNNKIAELQQKLSTLPE